MLERSYPDMNSRISFLNYLSIILLNLLIAELLPVGSIT